MLGWLKGWATTLHIMFFERDLYRTLTSGLNMSDFTEVRRPEDDEMHWTPPNK